MRRGGKASRAYIVGRSVDAFDKQTLFRVAAGGNFYQVGECGLSIGSNCKWEPQMPRFDFNLVVAPGTVLECQRDERQPTSIASKRDSSKAAQQLISELLT
jgi:hypothetical protein